MKKCPKLLITSPHGKEERAIEEVFNILFPLDISVECEKTRYPGVVLVYTNLDSREATIKIKNYPTSYIFRVVPVDCCTYTSIEEILKAVQNLSLEKLGSNKRFYVDCIRRGRRIPSSTYVEKVVGEYIVKNLNWKVDFQKPDYIIKIEVVDDLTCISKLTPLEVIVKKARSR